MAQQKFQPPKTIPDESKPTAPGPISKLQTDEEFLLAHGWTKAEGVRPGHWNDPKATAKANIEKKQLVVLKNRDGTEERIFQSVEDSAMPWLYKTREAVEVQRSRLAKEGR